MDSLAGARGVELAGTVQSRLAAIRRIALRFGMENIPAECAAIDSLHGDAESARLKHVVVVETIDELCDHDVSISGLIVGTVNS